MALVEVTGAKLAEMFGAKLADIVAPLPPAQAGSSWNTIIDTGGNMGEEKAVKPKQTGMALEMDVIKKITHQLERDLPPGAERRILAFVQDWAGRRALVPMPLAPNGQLPLAAKEDGFPE